MKFKTKTCLDCPSAIEFKRPKARRCEKCAYKRRLKQIQASKDKRAGDPVFANKRIARGMANYALTKGKLTRPERCELCNQIPIPLKNGQSGLRMDHYMGYGEENWLNVQFICIPCDTKQIKEDREII